MAFVKIGEYRIDTYKLLYFYKSSTNITLVYNFERGLEYVNIPIDTETEAGLKRLDSELKVRGQG